MWNPIKDYLQKQKTKKNELKRQKEIQDKKLTLNAKRKDIIFNLKKLKELIKYLDTTVMKTRKQRKQFWYDFVHREEIREQTITSLIKYYEDQERGLKSSNTSNSIQSKPEEKKDVKTSDASNKR